jgi:hypothetical protein
MIHPESLRAGVIAGTVTGDGDLPPIESLSIEFGSHG